jgi:cytidine deaminase
MEKIAISCILEVYDNIEALNKEQQQLIDAAIKALDTAYAPYSQFKVGAALLMEDGSIVSGSNQENAAYPSGLCAERVAFFTAGSQFPGKVIKSVAITTSYPLEQPIAPCGACRQVMAEYELKQKSPVSVLLHSENAKIYHIESCQSLLPLYFSGEWLMK